MATRRKRMVPRMSANEAMLYGAMRGNETHNGRRFHQWLVASGIRSSTQWQKLTMAQRLACLRDWRAGVSPSANSNYNPERDPERKYRIVYNPDRRHMGDSRYWEVWYGDKIETVHGSKAAAQARIRRQNTKKSKRTLHDPSRTSKTEFRAKARQKLGKPIEISPFGHGGFILFQGTKRVGFFRKKTEAITAGRKLAQLNMHLYPHDSRKWKNVWVAPWYDPDNRPTWGIWSASSGDPSRRHRKTKRLAGKK